MSKPDPIGICANRHCRKLIYETDFFELGRDAKSMYCDDVCKEEEEGFDERRS